MDYGTTGISQQIRKVRQDVAQGRPHAQAELDALERVWRTAILLKDEAIEAQGVLSPDGLRRYSQVRRKAHTLRRLAYTKLLTVDLTAFPEHWII